jgi:hypothetical protein
VIKPGEYQTLAGLENAAGPAGHRRLVVTRRQFSAAPEHRRHGGLTSIAEWRGTLAGSRTHAGQVSVDILDRNGRLHSSIELGYTGGRPGYDARYSLTTIGLEEEPEEEVTGEPEFIAELHDHHGTYQLRVLRAPDPAGLGQDQRSGKDMEVLPGPAVLRLPGHACPACARQHAVQALAAEGWELRGDWNWDSDDWVHWAFVRRTEAP